MATIKSIPEDHGCETVCIYRNVARGKRKMSDNDELILSKHFSLIKQMGHGPGVPPTRWDL